MPDLTPNLGIKKPTASENVSRASFNENWDIIDANAAPRSLAQLVKITADDGNVKYAVNDSSDFLAGLVALGTGWHTFYCVGTAVNAPPSGKTIRGFAHITGTNPTNGYLKATDYTGVSYSNYVFNGVWTGWETTVTDKAPTWTNLTLQNGGTNGNTIPPQYASVGSEVIFRGSLTIGTYGVQSFVLPTGVRPPNAVNLIAVNTASGRNGGVRAYIPTNGAVTFFGTINSGDIIDLTSMSFRLN